MESGAMIQIGAFVLGLVLGSFLNVVIARLPRGESIVHPPSRCPRCKKRIPAWDNIPVLSFVLLRGRCRHCKKAISCSSRWRGSTWTRGRSPTS
ncbi:MAG: prepilin peptidase [Candidatus Eisenbacteria bacterium]|uniref:Prepilin peptidase n=1 Tax=Eiseniibacteriota bacterium TaxID=2212470 RepID=A0A538T9Q4_UNCEI|nr:MAG: prepilin peptidase [Candidatus Eisenbacteria bacterium]